MITTWAGLVKRLIAEGAECLWQDLDGLHLASPPADALCTSIMWAWTTAGADGPLWRVRLDGDTCYVAEHHAQGQPGQRLAPWGEQQQIADARRRATDAPDPAGIALFQVVPRAAMTLPVPFFYRAAP